MIATQEPATLRVAETKTIAVNLRPGQAIRQGDVLIRRRRTGDLPPGLTIRTDRALAVGSRGSHVVTEPADLLDAPKGRVWLVSPAPFEVRHTEPDAAKRHHTFRLGAGTYESWGQVEFPAGVTTPSRVRD